MRGVGTGILLGSDLDLVREAKGGGKEAYGELVRRHRMSLLRLAYRFTKDSGAAEDVVQDTFIKAFIKLGTFEERSSFRSWLYRIAINNAKNLLRVNSKIDPVEIEDLNLTVQAEVEDKLAGLQVKSSLTRAVQGLPNRQKMALVLRVYEDLSFHEIAGIMGCTYDTAKAHFRHALIKLQNSFQGSHL